MKKILSGVLFCVIATGLIWCNTCYQKKEISIFKRRIVNPWDWQDNYGFVQGHEVSGAKRMLITAGQVSVDSDGNILYPGDMEKQITRVMDNMERLLNHAGYELSDVVRFTYFTTDVSGFIKAAPKALNNRLIPAGCKPATSLIGVKELFHPDIVVEIEATVVQ